MHPVFHTACSPFIQSIPRHLDTRTPHETTSKALLKVSGIHLFLPSLAEADIVEHGQVGQAGFFLDTSMLAVPNYLPVRHEPRNGFYENLLHNIPRERGEADQSLASWILLLAFLLKTSMSAFFQSSGLPMLIKTSLMVTSASSLSTLRCILPGSMGLRM